MSDDGLYVQCHSWAPKQQNRPRTVSRVMCLMMTHDYCPRCPHSRFELGLQDRVGQQEVACPRWRGDAKRYEDDPPTEYVLMSRETCLTTRPFEFCPSCPNSKHANLPLSEPGWYGGKRDEYESRGSTAVGSTEQDGAPPDSLSPGERRTSPEGGRPGRTTNPSDQDEAISRPRRSGPYIRVTEATRVLDQERGVESDKQSTAVLGGGSRKVYRLPVLGG